MAWVASTWTAPWTWSQSETITGAIMNQHIRDNLRVLGDFTRTVDGAAKIVNQVKSFGYGTGQANAAGGGNTELTNYTHTIPAKTLDKAGASIDLMMFWLQGPAAETATMKMSVGSSGVLTLVGSGAASTHPILHLQLSRRANNTEGLVHGFAYMGAGVGGASTVYVIGTSFTCNWDIDQSLKFYASSNTGNNLNLAYVNIDIWGGTIA